MGQNFIGLFIQNKAPDLPIYYEIGEKMIQAPTIARMSAVSSIRFEYPSFATFNIACPISRVDRI
jgi:hypothetical protein